MLAFFGYTHCPDVCPATVGVVNEVLAAVGDGPRAVFTSIDPERDDPAAMKSYLTYLPKAYVGLSGTPAEVRRNADQWGVKYARIEQESAAGYAMAHTADIFLVDAQGMLRAHFPFGTAAEPMIEAVRALLAETPPSAAASVSPDSPSAPAHRPRHRRAAIDGSAHRGARDVVSAGHAGHGRGAALPGDRLDQHLGRARRPRDHARGGRQRHQAGRLRAAVRAADPVRRDARGQSRDGVGGAPRGCEAALLRGADGHPLAGCLEAAA